MLCLVFWYFSPIFPRPTIKYIGFNYLALITPTIGTRGSK
jgi:hypothetical protein